MREKPGGGAGWVWGWIQEPQLPRVGSIILLIHHTRRGGGRASLTLMCVSRSLVYFLQECLGNGHVTRDSVAYVCIPV